MELGLLWLSVSLRGYGGEAPTGTVFFSLLGTQPHAEFQIYPSESAWQAARIVLFFVDMKDLQDSPEPFEEFAARVEHGFRRAAGWLRGCQEDSLERWRSTGHEVDIFLEGWLANEQLDLKMPPEFLLECGRLSLPITICTND